MKVTIVVGGRWHAFNLAYELEEQGNLHKLITNYPVWLVRRWGIPKEKVVSLPLTFWIVKIIYKLGGEALMMRCQWKVHSMFAKEAVKHLKGSDIVHGWSQWSEPSLLWSKKNGIPTVLERSSAQIEAQSELLRKEHRRLGLTWTETHPEIVKMELREYELSGAIVVPSKFVENTFLERGYPSSSIFRNSLGVDINHFRPPVEERVPPEVSGLKVIYAGSLSVRKGIPDLLEAFAKAELDGGTLTLVGGKTRELEDLIAKQPKTVVSVGHKPQADLIKYYAISHCFVLASVEEGMAMVQMQALACGLPLVCTTNTGGEDLLMLGGEGVDIGRGIIEYPAGFVVPINCPDKIALCLRKLESESGLWEEKSKNAGKIAEASLDWREYGKRASEIYRRLIHG